MYNSESQLESSYNISLSKWQQVLEEISENISSKIRSEEIKFVRKSRVKSLESLYAKKVNVLDIEKNQSKRITDLLGLRIIVPFLEDVETVVEIITDLFEVIDIERKSDSLSFKEFAYDSVHLDLSLKNYNIELPEFCSQSMEIQIRTILQDAWAEVEHELIYKSNTKFPDNKAIRKKMAALNANLALSDIIFQEIRDKQKELEVWGHERFSELQQRAKKITKDSIPRYKVGTESNKKITPNTEIEKIILKALNAHNKKNYRRAIDLYSEALKEAPLKIRAILYNHRGLAFFMLNKEKQALRDFEESIKCNPEYYQVINNRALVLRRMGLTEEALYNFTKSLELNKNQGDVYYLRAQTYYEMHKYEAAALDIQKAQKFNPQSEDIEELYKQIKKAL